MLGVGLGLRSGDESRGYRSLPAGGGLSLKMLLRQDPISHLGDLPGRKMLNIPTNRFGTFWGVKVGEVKDKRKLMLSNVGLFLAVPTAVKKTPKLVTWPRGTTGMDFSP